MIAETCGTCQMPATEACLKRDSMACWNLAERVQTATTGTR